MFTPLRTTLPLLVCGLSALATTEAYSQDSFNCSGTNNQVIVYCNDFETRIPVNGNEFDASTSYYDMSSTAIANAYSGSETRDPRITVNGLTGPAFIGQNASVETLRFNNYNYQTSDTSNKYGIGMVAKASSPVGADGEGYDLLAFTFDVINPDTGQIAPFIELQLDLAPAFLSTYASNGAAITPNYRLWAEAPRMKISLFDGQLTTTPVSNTNSPLIDAAVNNTPLPLASEIISGGTPAAATTNYQDYPVNFTRTTIRLDTTNVTNANGTVTVLMDLLDDRADSAGYRYATFDNLKVSIIKSLVDVREPKRIPSVGLVGLLSMVLVLLRLARRRFK